MRLLLATLLRNLQGGDRQEAEKTQRLIAQNAFDGGEKSPPWIQATSRLVLQAKAATLPATTSAPTNNNVAVPAKATPVFNATLTNASTGLTPAMRGATMSGATMSGATMSGATGAVHALGGATSAVHASAATPAVEPTHSFLASTDSVMYGAGGMGSVGGAGGMGSVGGLSAPPGGDGARQTHHHQSAPHTNQHLSPSAPLIYRPLAPAPSPAVPAPTPAPPAANAQDTRPPPPAAGASGRWETHAVTAAPTAAPTPHHTTPDHTRVPSSDRSFEPPA